MEGHDAQTPNQLQPESEQYNAPSGSENITATASQNQLTNRRYVSGRPRVNAKWNDDEKNWLVVNSMFGHKAQWLSDKLPWPRYRSTNAIKSRLRDMRITEKLPQRWRARDADPGTEPWTLEEDVETLQWHISGRERIDWAIYFDTNRSGASIISRADHLAQDVKLVTRAKKIKGQIKEVRLQYDGATGAEKEILGAKLEEMETNGLLEIRQAVQASPARNGTS